MTIWYKQGVCGDLQIVAQKGLGRIDNAYKKDLFVTSLRDGNHMPGSLHYIGLAFDIRPTMEKRDIKRILGPKWDVVDEGNHIHCEYDPK